MTHYCTSTIRILKSNWSPSQVNFSSSLIWPSVNLKLVSIRDRRQGLDIYSVRTANSANAVATVEYLTLRHPRRDAEMGRLELGSLVFQSQSYCHL